MTHFPPVGRQGRVSGLWGESDVYHKTGTPCRRLNQDERLRLAGVTSASSVTAAEEVAGSRLELARTRLSGHLPFQGLEIAPQLCLAPRKVPGIEHEERPDERISEKEIMIDHLMPPSPEDSNRAEARRARVASEPGPFAGGADMRTSRAERQGSRGTSRAFADPVPSSDRPG